MIELIDINKIKLNPNNPRFIRDNQYKKLMKSIIDFPEMLKLRPIVVDSEMTTIGGNMRLRACMEIGYKEVYIIKADNLTDEQKKEFIIKDNVGFGEWDFDMLANEWDNDDLVDWGLDVPTFNEYSGMKTTKDVLNGYNKTHILLSFSPDLMLELSKYLEIIKNIDGVEYESSSN
jgi:hypothetical protein